MPRFHTALDLLIRGTRYIIATPSGEPVAQFPGSPNGVNFAAGLDLLPTPHNKWLLDRYVMDGRATENAFDGEFTIGEILHLVQSDPDGNVATIPVRVRDTKDVEHTPYVLLEPLTDPGITT